MNQKDYQNFSTLWMGVSKNCRHDFDDIALAMAFKILKPFSFEDIKRGAEEHLADPDRGMFFPSPADIIKRIDSLRNRNDYRNPDGYPSIGPDMNRYGDVIRKLKEEGKIYTPVPSQKGDSAGERLKSVAARNRCVTQIRKWLPKFVPFEDKPENKGKTQAEIFDLEY